MNRKTFKTFQEEKKSPIPHCELVVNACDSDGEEFFVRFNEIENDNAHTGFTNCVRAMLRSGYQEAE